MVIECNLSAKSFRDAAEKVRAYRNSLDARCQTFCKMLASTGYSVVKYILMEHVDTTATIGSLTLDESQQDGMYTAKIQVTSDAIMFLEFGSGLAGQGTAPHAGNYGTQYGSGTFPSKAKRQNPEYANWENPEGWYYINGHGNLGRTTGMVASMPMYRGGQEMKRQMEMIARKVFKDD